MRSQFVIVKSALPPDDLTDVLNLDADPTFKANDYQQLAERLCTGVTWNGDEGGGTLFGNPVALVSTDACLFVHARVLMTDKQLEELHARALAEGAVVMDADSAELLSGDLDL